MFPKQTGPTDCSLFIPVPISGNAVESPTLFRVLWWASISSRYSRRHAVWSPIKSRFLMGKFSVNNIHHISTSYCISMTILCFHNFLYLYFIASTPKLTVFPLHYSNTTSYYTSTSLSIGNTGYCISSSLPLLPSPSLLHIHYSTTL